MAKDKFGNKVEIGDMVQIELSSPILYGRVVEISEGGLVRVGGQQHGRNDGILTPGRVKVAMEGHGDFSPETAGCAPGLLLIVDPSPQVKEMIQKRVAKEKNGGVSLH